MLSHCGINVIGRDGQVKFHITVDPSQPISRLIFKAQNFLEAI